MNIKVFYRPPVRPPPPRKYAALSPLPPLAALREQLSLCVTAVRQSKRDVRYELIVRHAASPTCWRAPTTSTRPSRRGCLRHCGQAKCPWIYTFVKSYFAGSATLIGLGGHSDCAVEKRRDALEHVLPSLQKFVANHQNATACFIVASSVMQLVTDFVLRDMSDKRHPLNELCGCGCSGSLGSLRDSVCSCRTRATSWRARRRTKKCSCSWCRTVSHYGVAV
ncbi:hypothetical protein PR001_g2356 [Phytophthora rubi]|uniref:Uncharacterized protein n=1 Tax=Phytophthora rubi TaxID=129364 RepID=A0A6A3NXV0_9STRA|nr:hypothetical protein PR001_g2356 [Phytophthora rubi]